MSTSDTAADGSASTTPAAPPTTAPDDQVAVDLVFGDGAAGKILHGDLNKVAGPTRSDDEFVKLAFNGTVPKTFEATVLTQTVWARVLDDELKQVKAAMSDADRAQAKDLLFEQLTTLFPDSTNPKADAEKMYGRVPYLPFIVDLQAREIALAAVLKKTAPANSGNPCVAHILVATQAEGNQVVADLKGGTDFATEAKAKSTDPGSKDKGGDLGCVDPDNYVQGFADAVKTAPVGQIVGPVQSSFGWHIIRVDHYEADGDRLAQDQLKAGLGAARITVDTRIGNWDANKLSITPAP